MREMLLREDAHDFDSETCLILVGQDPLFIFWASHLDYSKGGFVRLTKRQLVISAGRVRIFALVKYAVCRYQIG